MVKTKDLRTMTIDELNTKLVQDKKEQFNLRVQQSTGQLSNTNVYDILRKDKLVLTKEAVDCLKERLTW